MAILSDLVETIARVEGTDAATVGLIARYLREAGLIATHGRGPSAAKMRLTDASNLLIGVNATSGATNAARIVKTYRHLHALEFRSLSDPRPQSSWGTLGDAIEQLLCAAGTGELPDPFMGQGLGLGFQEAFFREEVRVELRFRKSAPAAFLRMTELPAADETEPARADQWTAVRSPDFSSAFFPLRPRGPTSEKKKLTGDRIEETMISYRTLRAVGKLIG